MKKDARLDLTEHAAGFMASRMLQVAAKLGIAELLAKTTSCVLRSSPFEVPLTP
jgi:hypothetical protein